MGFFRQEYWSGLPFPSPGDLPDPEIETTFPVSPALQAGSLSTEGSPPLLRATIKNKFCYFKNFVKVLSLPIVSCKKKAVGTQY